MSLPADPGAEAVEQVDHNSPQGVGGVQIVPQVVNQRRRHQPPDRSAGPGVDPVSAVIVDQKASAQKGDGIDQRVPARPQPVFEIEAIDPEADHIAGEMIKAEVQKRADHQPQVFSPLQRPFIHPVFPDHILLALGEFTDQPQDVQSQNNQRRDGNSFLHDTCSSSVCPDDDFSMYPGSCAPPRPASSPGSYPD